MIAARFSADSRAGAGRAGGVQESVQRENSRGVRKRAPSRARTREDLPRPPDPRLRFDPDALGLVEPPRSFYRRETVSVAKDLLRVLARAAIPGEVVRRADRRNRGVPRDRRRRRAFLERPPHGARRADVRGRRAPLRLPRVRDAPLRERRHSRGGNRPGRPAARRRAPRRPPGAPAVGPGKALRRPRHHGLGHRPGSRRRRPDPDLPAPSRAPPRITASPRIGVDYAGDAAAWPLRFFIADSEAVSGKRSV